MHIITRRAGLPVLVMALAAMMISGCSAQSADDGTFWNGLRVNALERNPPTTLAELVDRADFIVIGKVLAIETGPEDKSADGAGPIIQTVALVAGVDDVVKGTLDAEEVKIVMVPAGPVDLVVKEKPTGNKAMFFLVQRSDGYYACVSLSGLVEDTSVGLVTVVDPVQSELASGESNSQKTFDDLVREVRSLVK